MRYVKGDNNLAVRMSNTYKTAQILGVISAIIGLLTVAFVDAHFYPITAFLGSITMVVILIVETVPSDATKYTKSSTKAAIYFIATIILLPFIWPSILLFLTGSLYLIDTYRKVDTIV